MSTSELFISEDEFEALVADSLQSDNLIVYGDDGQEIGLCPYISFYIYNRPDDFLSLAARMASVCNRFEQEIVDEPMALKWHGRDQEWLKPGDPRLSFDMEEYARRSQDDARVFWLRSTDMDSPAATPRWSFNAVADDGIGSYSLLKLSFRQKWYLRNAEKWHSFVGDCIRELTPDHCYSGFEIGNGGFNILGAYECDVLERLCAERLFGMDIDHPESMYFHRFDDPSGFVMPNSLGAGIRTPTWCFMLSPFWQAKLGKTEAEIRAELDDPRIHITAIPYPVNEHYPNGGNGLWIRLGELDLYPVEQGLPELLVKANRLIRPIRCDGLALLTLDPWDDDPNPRFDYPTGLRWMRRFDDDSDWPDAARRQALPMNGQTTKLRARPGEPVPRSGVWWTPALQGDEAQRRLNAGERLPDIRHSSYGEVIWYWRGA
jgi:hypothetical protein